MPGFRRTRTKNKKGGKLRKSIYFFKDKKGTFKNLYADKRAKDFKHSGRKSYVTWRKGKSPTAETHHGKFYTKTEVDKLRKTHSKSKKGGGRKRRERKRMTKKSTKTLQASTPKKSLKDFMGPVSQQSPQQQASQQQSPQQLSLQQQAPQQQAPPPAAPAVRRGLKSLMGEPILAGRPGYTEPFTGAPNRKIRREQLEEMLKFQKRAKERREFLSDPKYQDLLGPIWMDNNYLTKQQAHYISHAGPKYTPRESYPVQQQDDFTHLDALRERYQRRFPMTIVGADLPQHHLDPNAPAFIPTSSMFREFHSKPSKGGKAKKSKFTRRNNQQRRKTRRYRRGGGPLSSIAQQEQIQTENIMRTIGRHNLGRAREGTRLRKENLYQSRVLDALNTPLEARHDEVTLAIPKRIREGTGEQYQQNISFKPRETPGYSVIKMAGEPKYTANRP